MEPFEWLLLAAGLAVGGVLGAQSSRVKKSAARGYLVVEEKARDLSAGAQKVRSRIDAARSHKAERNGAATSEESAPRKAGATRSRATKKARTKTTRRASTARHAA